MVLPGWLGGHVHSTVQVQNIKVNNSKGGCVWVGGNEYFESVSIFLLLPLLPRYFPTHLCHLSCSYLTLPRWASEEWSIGCIKSCL